MLRLSTWAGPGRRSAIPGLLVGTLMALGFGLSLAAPLDYTVSDPWGNLLTAQALVEHGTVRLDAYAEADSIARLGLAVRHDGHLYYYFPIGTPLLLTPIVAVARELGFDAAETSQNATLQRWLAATTVAFAILLVFRLARRWLRAAPALLVTVAFGFGSSTISTLGTALWSHNSAFLLHLLLLLVLTDPARTERRSNGVTVGVLAFLAFLCRPTSAALVVVTFGFLALRRRTWLAPAMVSSGLLLLGFLLLSEVLYGDPLPPYYLPTRLGSPELWTALVGNLVSPTRGLFVSIPFLVVPMVGLLFWWRRLRTDPMVGFGLVWATFHLATLASFRNWWGGWCFGNRLFSDALPSLLLVTIAVGRVAATAPRRARRTWWTAFGLLVLPAIFFHSIQGLYEPSTSEWCRDGTYTRYLFDWRHPQILASPESLADHRRVHLLPALAARDPARVVLPDDRDVIFEGWSSSEGDGAWRWTSATAASILFRAADREASRGAWTLEIEASTLGDQDIGVRVQGVEVGTLRGRSEEPGTHRFDLPDGLLTRPPPELGSEDGVEIGLEIPGARLASTVDPDSLDPRLLGLRLWRLRLVPEEPAATAGDRRR